MPTDKLTITISGPTGSGKTKWATYLESEATLLDGVLPTPVIIDDNSPPNYNFDYLEESARTASGEFHGEFVEYKKFVKALEDFMTTSYELDRYKKLMFYGEDQKKGRLRDPGTFIWNGHDIIDNQINNLEEIEKYRYILHALLGVMTEAGELAEALFNSLESDNSQPLDLTNLLEESGDVKWYLAMLARALGNTWDADERVNIAKLRHRFPDKFTENQANERDLEAERKILES